MPTPEWAERLLARDRDAVSPALNLVDDTRPEAIEATRRLLDEVESAGLDRAPLAARPATCTARAVRGLGAPSAQRWPAEACSVRRQPP